MANPVKGKKVARHDTANKVRFIMEGAIQKIGIQACIDLLAEEVAEQGFATTFAKLKGFVPTEIQADVTQHTIEEFVTGIVSTQTNDSTAKTLLQ